MTITISAVLLFGVLLAAAMKFGGLRLTFAVVAVLFGFYLASSSAAPTVNHVLTSVSNFLHGH